MKLLAWSPELTIPPPSNRKEIYWPIGEQTLTRSERNAWIDQIKDRYSFGYYAIQDAQNDAGRGVMEAIYALHVFKIYLIAERLDPS